MAVSRDAPLSDNALEELSERVIQLEAELAAIRQALAALADPRPVELPSVEASPPFADPDHWCVTMLGPFHLRRSGVDAPPCSSRRGRSVLKYLLCSADYAAPQSVLVEAFWPDADPTTGAHNLQMAVHALRRSLLGWGPGGSNDVVMYRCDHYRLNPTLSIKQDVQRFQDAVRAGQQAMRSGELDAARRDFEQARALYGGSFLCDTPYDDWAEPKRAGLHDMQLMVLAQLSRLYEREGDWDRAAGCCEEVLGADAFREDAYRQLMRCKAALGRRAEVRRVFQSCQERLWRELQVEPALETRQLFEALSSGS
jgi:DNA-binding SARP family transcriptional activator